MSDESKKEYKGFGELKVLEISPVDDVPVYSLIKDRS
jgi:hypothetical protein